MKQSVEDKIRILNSVGNWAYIGDCRYDVDHISSEVYRLFSDTLLEGFRYDEIEEEYIKDLKKEDIDYGLSEYAVANYNGIEYPLMGWDKINLESVVITSKQPLEGLDSDLYDRGIYTNEIPLNNDKLLLELMIDRAFDLPLRQEFEVTLMKQAVEDKIKILKSTGTWAYIKEKRFDVFQIDHEVYRLYSDTDFEGFSFDETEEEYIKDVKKEEIDYGELKYAFAIFRGETYSLMGWDKSNFQYVVIGSEQQPLEGCESNIYDRGYYANRVPLNHDELTLELKTDRAFDLPTRTSL